MKKLFLLILVSATFIYGQKFNRKYLEGLKPRNIGPAGMSGRVTTIDVVEKNKDIIYVGTASGGLWRSTNGGTSWEPIFENESAASVGAVAVDQNVPDVIWVGTGEGNPRNSQTMGRGIFKSLDGGRSWKYLGLGKTRAIHRIIIDPRNSNVVYVAALGNAWVKSKERGVYRTTDGGKSWEKILYKDDLTGCADLVMDPANPNKLIAAMWTYRRWPWFFKSGGKNSGIYVTFDCGKTWQKRSYKNGLPGGELGRIGLAIARNMPNIVYALVEAKKNALYRSEDGGFNWQKVADKNIGGRPFYFADIFVDPQNENRIYNLYTMVSVSNDGGRTFKTLIPYKSVHPDHHAWWIDSEDGKFIIDGNDGGIYISKDRGKTWSFVGNLPVGQFYHINIDLDSPYHVYGGLQDNGSWRGPAFVYRWGGILNSYWEELGFGDGFDVLPFLPDTRFGFAMSQGGNVYRYDLKTGAQKNIKPYDKRETKLRFNWNAAIAQDPFEPKTIYFGSQFLHKSTNMGNTWQIISPDLTTNDKSKQNQLNSGGLTYDVTDAENYTTIISIAPSPIKKGVIWVGTDDGNVQLTKDGGKEWTNLIKNIKGAPIGGWVAQIRASYYNPAEAFVIINNYRKGDWNPYLFHTTDYGKSWENLTGDKGIDGYTLAFLQDPVEPKLMFLGTEFGFYFSTDAGNNWIKWAKNFPTVSTMDFAYQPVEKDLVIGTFGRSVWVLDNIVPLRSLCNVRETPLKKNLKLFNIPDAFVRFTKRPAGGRFTGSGEFRGENKPLGAMITFWVKNIKKNIEEKSGNKKNNKALIKIFDSKNNEIRTLKVKVNEGFNRIYWGLHERGVRFPAREKLSNKNSEPIGPFVLPGKYKVKLLFGEMKDSAFVNVKFDDRVRVKINNLLKRKQMLKKVEKLTKITVKGLKRISEARNMLSLINGWAKGKDSLKVILKQTKLLEDSLKNLEEIVLQKEVQGIRRDESRTGIKLRKAYSSISGWYDMPGERESLLISEAEKSVKNYLNRQNRFFSNTWNKFIEDVLRRGFSIIKTFNPLEIK